MLVTKSEFREMFNYSDLASVSRLIRKNSIIANDDGTIDLELLKNKKWARDRNNWLVESKTATSAPDSEPKQAKNEGYFGLEFDLLNQKLKEKTQQTTLLDLKIAKEKKEVIETEVLDRVLMTVFNALFQNLAELPSIYVDDLIAIIKTNNSPKEQFVRFLTDKIVSQIQSALDIAENTAKKHYESS